MSGAVRMSLTDIAHRTLVSGLFGLSVYGLYGIYTMHNERLAQGLVALKLHEEEEARAKQMTLANGFVDPPTTRPS